MIGKIRIRTVTFGRKIPVQRYGNAEFILTAEVGMDQSVEEVMAGLRKIVQAQLSELKNDEGD